VLDDLILKNRGAETNIIVTQPRRISAIGVSGRIAEERCERVGDTCGYSVRLEAKRSKDTRILFCTVSPRASDASAKRASGGTNHLLCERKKS
jgi:HrpA-like RNA helicase